ncbi:MAG: serpin family protein [Oscillospiraceae bacterium]
MKRMGAIFLSIALALSLGACAPADTPGESGGPSGLPEQSEAPMGEAATPLKAVSYPQAIGFEDYETKQKVREDNPVSEETMEAMSRFSYRTAAALLEGTKNENYSPLSLYLALALCSTGAKGSTQAEILALLGAEDAAALAEQCGNFYRQFYADNEVTKRQLANSVWMDRNTQLKTDFYERAAKQFYAEAYQADFSDPATGKAIGTWIAKHTNGTLTPEIAIDPQDILQMINTVYFYDQWVDKFDETQTKADVFHGAKGDETIDFLNQTFASHGFFKGDGFTRSSLGLKGGGEMIFVLPDEGTKVQTLLETPEKLQSALEGGESTPGKVIWSIPKFSFDAKYGCKDMLEKLGVKAAFVEDADFSALTDGVAYVSDVVQETHIGINEKGVEASAFTQISYAGSAMPLGEAEMVLNRPFLYGIVQDGVLLFVGVYQGEMSQGT